MTIETIPLVLGLPILGIFFLYSLGGFFIVQPRMQVVVLRFGNYVKTIQEDGIAYVFPMGRKLYHLSSQVISIDLPRMMVLEANGNPLEVSAVCAYQVREARKAVLEVENCNFYVHNLATAVVKNVCSHYPYETPDPNQPCLKKESELITRHLIHELQELVEPAGVEILQVRFNDLTYAPEIAQSMLLRQQALAMVDARRTIVEGAVWTVVNAQQRMQAAGLALAPELADSFASNLMLVLCSGERVQTFMPIEIAVPAAPAPAPAAAAPAPRGGAQ
jgi:regulator of protease activity HflC (stomatin/prohibitin superfamily)